MFKLALYLLFFSLCFAKITKNQFLSFSNYEQTLKEVTGNVGRKSDSELNDKVWVIDLNDEALNFNRLYLANKAEEQVFNQIIAPAIENYNRQNSVRIKKDDPLKEASIERPDEVFKNKLNINQINKTKKDMLTMINKFFTTQLDDPYLNDAHITSNKTLKLYFIGPYTSLIMTSEKSRYQYFINPPSPFPNWFYEEKNIVNNGIKKYVDIPIEVQYDFLVKLLDVLNMYISFPV